VRRSDLHIKRSQLVTMPDQFSTRLTTTDGGRRTRTFVGTEVSRSKGVKEPSVHASRRQSLECNSQPFLILGAYGAQVNRDSVTKHGGGVNPRRLRMPPNEDSREDSFDRGRCSVA